MERSDKQPSPFDSKVIDLAVKVDDCLQKEESAGQTADRDSAISNLNDEELAGLTPQEMLELTEAVEAISFLGHVREDFKRKPSRKPGPPWKSAGNQSTVSQFETIGPFDHAATDDAPLNESFGRFTIVESVGQGGFARVFRALDPLLDREVALKIPRPNVLVSDEAQLRFQREAKIAAMLSHPSIVPVFETGSVGPISFIASAFCPGQTLADWMSSRKESSETETDEGESSQGNRFDFECIAEIVAELALAVNHAHQRGLIHRDLKPANILVEDGTEEIAKRLRITDFGLAKRIQNDDATLTTDGAIVGTPQYMSPEQANGKATVCEGTDIYSLGVILYELLTGTVPFAKESLLLTLKAVENESPVQPRAINKAIPNDLEAICLKCLRKSATDRYAAGHELAEDLFAWRDGKTVQARHATRLEKLWRWCRRNPGLAAALSFAFVSLSVGLAVSSFLWRSADAQKDLASQQRVLAEFQRDRAQSNIALLQQTTENVMGQYLSLDESVVRQPSQRKIIYSLIQTHKTLLEQEAENLDDLPTLIESFTKVARLYNHIGDHTAAADVCEFVRQLVDQAYENHPDRRDQILMLDINIRLENVHQSMADGRNSESARGLETLTLLMNEYERDFRKPISSQKWLNVYRRQGVLLLAQHDYANAEASLWRYHALAIESLAIEPDKKELQLDYSISLQLLGEACFRQGKFDAATKHYRLALKDHRERKSLDTRAIATVLQSLACVEMRLGRSREARENFQLAIEMLEAGVAKHPEDVRLLNRYVHTLKEATVFYRWQREHDEEKALLQKGLKLSDGVKHKGMRLRYQMFFRVRLGQLMSNQFADSTTSETVEALMDQAIAIGESNLKDYPDHFRIRDSLVAAYLQKGSLRAAAGELELANKLMESGLKHANQLLANRPDMHSIDLAIRTSGRVTDHYCQHEQFDEAVSSLSEFARNNATSMEIQHGVARCLCAVVKHHRTKKLRRQERLEIETLAFDCLETAIELGFDDANELRTDKQWRAVSSAARFQELLERIEN